jgi:hypothetical protein
MKAARIQRFGPLSVITIDAGPGRNLTPASCYVTTAVLNKITEMFNSGKLVTDIGTVLPREEARHAHETLEGAPHKRARSY